MAIPTLNEWARENNFNIDSIGQQQNDLIDIYGNSGVGGGGIEMEVLYDEEHVTRQVNDWIHKLIGLCSPVPKEERQELTEQIVKAIRHHLG